jgi:hypothetical protein
MNTRTRPHVVFTQRGARHAVYVRYARHTFGGYQVRRRDNDRLLGWVRPADTGTGWTFTVHRSAFRGIGIDDLGHSRDAVPATLYRPIERPYRLHTRTNATWELVAFLVHHGAPAVGFPTHRDVRVYQGGDR